MPAQVALWMDEWLEAPSTEEQQAALATMLSQALRRQVPLRDESSPNALAQSIERAGAALHRLRAAMLDEGVTIQAVHGFQAEVEYIKNLFSDVQGVRELGELAFLTGEWTIACKVVELPVAAGGRPPKTPDPASEVFHVPSLRELVGNPKYGWRLKMKAQCCSHRHSVASPEDIQ
jgi:hypothetical protein